MKEDKKREKNDRNMLLIFFMKKDKLHPHAKAPVIFFGLPMLELNAINTLSHVLLQRVTQLLLITIFSIDCSEERPPN